MGKISNEDSYELGFLTILKLIQILKEAFRTNIQTQVYLFKFILYKG